MKIIFKTLGICFLFCACMILIETLYFSWVAITPSDSTSHVDAIVVFSGSSNRIRHAYDLARSGVSKTLIISPASRRRIDDYERWYAAPEKMNYLIEEKAQTTFTNAFHVAELIRTNRLSSVLLVTSDYHMPRSFFLLNLLALGTDCRIRMSKVDSGKKLPENWNRRITTLKIAYNEMVQLWGSLIEGGLYAVGGDRAWLRKSSSGATQWMRKHLLFDTPCLDCG